MPSRRPHTKSRNGCVECKAKKVKCDQGKPVCARCTRCKQSCHYQVLPGKAYSPHQTLSSDADRPPLSIRLLWPTLASPHDPPREATFTASDLELMHHYCTTAFLPRVPKHWESKIWQEIAPAEAFKHRFLLHGVLAISALHRASLHPDMAPQNTLLAMQHYTSAIGLFRPVLDDIRPDNAVAAFILAGLLVCISWALPMVQPDAHGVIPPPTAITVVQHVLDIVKLQRGVRDIVSSGWEWTRSVASFFDLVCNEPEVVFPSEVEAALGHLEWRINAEIESEELRKSYHCALQDFKKFYPLKGCPDPQSLVHAWLTQVPSELIDEMGKMRPLALVMLAYHGALLYGLERCWWVGDKGKVLVLMVEELVPPGYGDAMAWPKRQIGVEAD